MFLLGRKQRTALTTSTLALALLLTTCLSCSVTGSKASLAPSSNTAAWSTCQPGSRSVIWPANIKDEQRFRSSGVVLRMAAPYKRHGGNGATRSLRVRNTYEIGNKQGGWTDPDGVVVVSRLPVVFPRHSILAQHAVFVFMLRAAVIQAQHENAVRVRVVQKDLAVRVPDRLRGSPANELRVRLCGGEGLQLLFLQRLQQLRALILVACVIPATWQGHGSAWPEW